MKKLLLLLVLTGLILTVGCGGEKKDAKTSESTGNAMIIAEGPLPLPEGSNSEAVGITRKAFHIIKKDIMMWPSSIFRKPRRLILLWERLIITKRFHSTNWENTVKRLNISTLL